MKTIPPFRVVGLAWLALAPLALSAQTLSNPSFEADSFAVSPGYASANGDGITGWTVSPADAVGLNPAGGSPFADNGVVPDGLNVAFLQSKASALRTLSNNITGLVPGVVYEVSFRANARGGTNAAPSPTWSLNGEPFVPFIAGPAVGAGKPYRFVVGAFTATATEAPLVVANQTAGDSVLLVDDFRVVARSVPGSGWTLHRWVDGADSGVSPSETLWGHLFNSASLANLNGVVFSGLSGTNPISVGRFESSGFGQSWTDLTNQLTGLAGPASAELARNAVQMGAAGSFTLLGLSPGQGYRLSLFGLGQGTPGTGLQTFAAGADSRELDTAAFGIGGGVRVDHSFIATGVTHTVTVTPKDSAPDLLLCGVALAQPWRLVLDGPALVTHECHEPYVERGAFRDTIRFGAGQYHDVVLRGDGTLVVWSGTVLGQTNLPATATNVATFAVGHGHTVALRRDGTAVAWGNNNFGQGSVPAGVGKVVAVSAGIYHNLVLRADGTVAAWGYNNLGQTNVPSGLSRVVDISAGSNHGLALRSDGRVVAWGYNSVGQTNVPASATNIVAISAGGFHNLAIRRDGTVLSWGQNAYGQVTLPAGISNVVAVSAGEYHSMALRRDGKVFVWGYGNYGQTNLPPDLSNVVAIASGYNHCLALKSDGRLVAWGLNDVGQAQIPAHVYLPDQVTQSGSVDANAPGVYTLTYSAPHGTGLVQRVRQVVVRDTLPPVLNLNGPETIFLTERAFTDPGAVALDACGGELSVTVSNRVNLAVPGLYTNAYFAIDPSGNIAERTRVVAVILPAHRPGDTDGDGLVSRAELETVLGGVDGGLATINAAGYYTPAQVQALNLGVPLLSQTAPGQFKLTLGLQKATQLTNFVAFPFLAPQTTVNAEGNVEFLFTSPDAAAFFRLEGR